jgi:hypothetical protein
MNTPEFHSCLAKEFGRFVELRRLAVAQHAAGQQAGDIAEFDLAGRGLDGGETPQVHLIAHVQFLTTHEFVAGGQIPLGDHEFLGPPGNPVFVEAHHQVALV